MTKTVSVTPDMVIELLSNHPEGLDLITITEQLKVDIKDIKPILTDLQNRNQVSSGLKKIENKSIFNRYYFFL